MKGIVEGPESVQDEKVESIGITTKSNKIPKIEKGQIPRNTNDDSKSGRDEGDCSSWEKNVLRFQHKQRKKGKRKSLQEEGKEEISLPTKWGFSVSL